MLKKLLFLILFVMLAAIPILAQDVPDEIDDPTGDWEDIIEQLADDGYINEDEGELVLEENRIRFDDDDAIFILFDTDAITDFVMSVTLQIDDVDEDEFAFCMVTFRDTVDEGFLAAGVSSFSTVNLYDSIFDNEDDSSLIDFVEHGGDVDDDFHLTVVALDDEVTVYVDGELVFAEDDLSVRIGDLGLLRTLGADCDADDLWIWEIDNSASGTAFDGKNSDPDEATNSEVVELPEEIDDFDGTSESVIAQFEAAGVIGSGNAFLFGEDFAFIGASGSSFTSLGRNRNRTDVILAGEVTFDSESSDYEQCGLLVRVDDSRDPVLDFLFIGVDSDGDVFIQNNSQEEDGTFDFIPIGVDLDDSHHFIIVARGDRLAIYLDGELILADYPIYEVRGIFGIAQISDSVDSSCEGRNIWVYDTPFFEPGVCNVLATGNVNQRSEPTTSSDIAGQLSSGESLEVVSQTEPGDGFIWYELEDDSYVREDIISLVGDCNNLDES
ncbi:MAG: SH3 domain-containing protein [Phototrophicaceae bacterium]